MKVNVYSAIGSFAGAAPAKDAAENAINSSSAFQTAAKDSVCDSIR